MVRVFSNHYVHTALEREGFWQCRWDFQDSVVFAAKLFSARIFGKKAFAGLGPGELLLRFELLGSCWTLFRGKIREKLWKMSA